MPRGYSARTVGAISVWVRQGGNFFVAPLKHHRERLHLLSDHRSGGLTANERIGATELVPEVVISWACLRMSTAARGSGSPFSTRSQSASCSFPSIPRRGRHSVKLSRTTALVSDIIAPMISSNSTTRPIGLCRRAGAASIAHAASRRRIRACHGSEISARLAP